MYDFEWLIAERMDGSQTLSEVAAWASARFGFSPSTDDLAVYAKKLGELGWVDAGAPAPMTITVDDEPEVEVTRPSVAHAPEPMSIEVAMPPEPAPPPRYDPPRYDPPAPAPAPRFEIPEPPRGMSVGPSTATLAPIAEPQGKRGGSPITWVLILLLLGGGGFAVYYYVIAPGLEPAHVKVQLAPPPREVVRYYDGKATVARSEPQTLSFGESGKVADVVAAGTEVKAGQTLASLDTTTAIEKELADVKDRHSFYEGQLKAAQAKGNAEDIKKFEEKVAEKKKRLGQLEDREKKVRLTASGHATVAEVLVTAGNPAKEGDPAIKLVDKRLVAEFKLAAADATALKPGATISVAPDAGAAAQARVISAAGGAVKVELLDDGGGAVKIGTAISLIKSRTPNVVRQPLAAVSKSQGGADQVYVLSGGVVHARPVTVIERTATEAYITSGLTTGESVVVSATDTLQDGQKASAE
jgi:multidrug efflux pump subunit AcrA (membrane-fusion protein)